MSSFLPVDLNLVETVRSNAINVLPPTMSTQVGNQLVGQVGNSVLLDKIQGALADKGTLGGIASQLLRQQSPFPYKKAVSFMLLDRNRSLATPPPNNIDQFAPGYFFKMLVNPSNFVVTMPNKTVVPVRTLGGWKVQHWYPDIGSIQADGSIGNMLERMNRDLKDSNAWRSFRKLMGVYQNNGIGSYQSTRPGSNRKSAQAAFTPTAVCIYDKVWYEGYFESLNYTESEDTPHTVKYSMSFKFLTYTDLNDIPGLTRERSVDASVFNAVTSAFGGQQAIAGKLGGFGG